MKSSVSSAYLDKRAAILVGILITMIAAMAFAPSIPQNPAYHQFADDRKLFGIANIANIASNLGFFIAGGLGLWGVTGGRRNKLFEHKSDALPYQVFFASVILIGVGSSYYHYLPTTQRLMWDRLPMTIAFMAFFAAFVSDRIDRRLGLVWVLPIAVTMGIASLIYWARTENLGAGDLRAYGLVQFGSFVLLPAMCLLFKQKKHTDGKYLVYILLAYLAAKLSEHFDREVFELTGHAISGHSLKHLVAAIACYLPLAMLQKKGL